MTRSILSRVVLAGALIAGLPAPLAFAQQEEGSVVDRALATRAELEAEQARLQRATDKDDVAALSRVRARLERGDFRPGDLVLIEVEAESTLTDTFTVGRNRELRLPPPTVGELSLAGILRAELADTVASYIGRFVQAPRVRATPLLRLTIQGEVVRAGVYGVPADAVLADALMASGGATANADLRKVRVERNGESILSGKTFEQALAQGLTLDQALIQNGDRLVISRRPDFQGNLRFLWVIVSLAGGVYGLSRAF